VDQVSKLASFSDGSRNCKDIEINRQQTADIFGRISKRQSINKENGSMNHPKMRHISVGKDGTVWAVGKEDGTIYRLYGDAGYIGWVANSVGKADVIAAVDWGSAWCVNRENEIWQVENANTVSDAGTWTRIATHSGESDARSISVGKDGSVWYVQRDGTLFQRNGDQWQESSVGKAIYAVGNYGSVWGINETYRAGHLLDGMLQEPTGQGFKQIAWSISAGEDGSVWYNDTDGNLYFHEADGDAWVKDENWNRAQMGNPIVLAVHNQGTVWCVNGDGDVWHSYGPISWSTSSERQWRRIGDDVTGPMPATLEEFDVEFGRLWQEVEANFQGLGGRYETVDELLQYCELHITFALGWLTANDSPAEQRVKTEIAFSERSWQRFAEDSEIALQLMLHPLSNVIQSAGLEKKDIGFVKAEALRGRFKQLRRLIDMQLAIVNEAYGRYST
jgi:hypothetical protein